MPPPPPLGWCPKCEFTEEPSCFLRTYGQAVSSEPLRHDVVEAKDPSSSKGMQVKRGSWEVSALGVPESILEVRILWLGCRGGLARMGSPLISPPPHALLVRLPLILLV